MRILPKQLLFQFLKLIQLYALSLVECTYHFNTRARSDDL
ncbi:hypothetical protein HMP0015_1858 [Acinetobacter haemolyticus ATCC 19194]|uniref:Uncharacterized protein n=1 Tax=Acinetobacter haemolyticus ATCC 19194 TaxID=707232 RepID=D4XQ66_ACIHA|nr:hypothetical protein HMP0015_1858 [Acinetobacter haemolyticus ATCC 19194]